MEILIIEDDAGTARSMKALILAQIKEAEIEVAGNLDAGVRNGSAASVGVNPRARARDA